MPWLVSTSLSPFFAESRNHFSLIPTEADTYKVLHVCLFPDRSNQARAALSRKPGPWCWREHLEGPHKGILWLNLPPHQELEDKHVAAAALSPCNLQSVLSGGSSSVNIIKASAYYLFLCVWCWSPLVVQIRQDWWMWICLKLKQARDNEKSWLKVLINYREFWDIRSMRATRRPSFQSQEVERQLLPTLWCSLPWHGQVSRATGAQLRRTIVYRSGALWGNLAAPKVHVVGRFIAHGLLPPCIRFKNNQSHL